MKKYQILINDRNYSSWVILDSETNKEVDLSDPLFINVNPVERKMFSRDIFYIDDTGMFPVVKDGEVGRKLTNDVGRSPESFDVIDNNHFS